MSSVRDVVDNSFVMKFLKTMGTPEAVNCVEYCPLFSSSACTVCEREKDCTKKVAYSTGSDIIYHQTMQACDVTRLLSLHIGESTLQTVSSNDTAGVKFATPRM